MAVFTKILIANRGEIAIRVARACRELGISPVAVYSEADRAAAHVVVADEAYLLGPGTPSASYLNVPKIIETALSAGADAIHPGYGFLAENAGFARACAEAGITWIGPPPEAIEAMGSKIAARERMKAAGVPIVPGTTEPLDSVETLLRLGEEIGWPLAIKASSGGGGKGLKVVPGPDEAERAFESAQREGLAYFADATVYIERYIEDPRHVEVQVLADGHGNVIHLGERDCTIQRRHQKLIEESPSPAVSPELRARIGQIAVDAARAVGYRSAGTIEGLLSREGEYFFLEMNTRIQVEHTVTEMVTGLDLVREQILIAAGEPMSVGQDDVRLHGHAFECRINAEDVGRGFLPAPGTVTRYREPSGPGVRVDSGVVAGTEISPLYDPMIAKLIVHGQDREHARMRMLRALDEFVIEGTPTLLGFHRALLSRQEFIDGETCHGIVESPELAELAAQLDGVRPGAFPSGETVSQTRMRTRVATIEVDGQRREVTTFVPEPAWAELARRRKERAKSGGASSDGAVESPMQGTILGVRVTEGESVETGQVLCIVEAMKMENEIAAPHAGVVAELSVDEGDAVRVGQLICQVVADNAV
jgi:acetyl-CoA/propionyl-CoA carboxylase biotin carboxyl carrier protein